MSERATQLEGYIHESMRSRLTMRWLLITTYFPVRRFGMLMDAHPSCSTDEIVAQGNYVRSSAALTPS